jgi:hypothetical protein
MAIWRMIGSWCSWSAGTAFVQAPTWLMRAVLLLGLATGSSNACVRRTQQCRIWNNAGDGCGVLPPGRHGGPCLQHAGLVGLDVRLRWQHLSVDMMQSSLGVKQPQSTAQIHKCHCY